MSQLIMASDDALIAVRRASADQQFAIVLQPISHAELGEIRIDENLFAIGRKEAPFVSYAPEIVADLSRRHARIFAERGAVYIADMDSKNGTTVNQVDVQQKITRLRDGDVICFGKALTYRVQLGALAYKPARVTRLQSLTLTPERSEAGLQLIVVTQFPFLVSKADDTFSRYKEAFPHEVKYISRRHAHIFLKAGVPFVEDLGSTNGTFVGGTRLDEQAVALKDADTLAFGGHHFVYRVSVQLQEAEIAPIDPTLTKFSTAAPSGAKSAVDADRTTFVAVADSFLDIFCIDHAQKQDDEVNVEAAQMPDIAAKGAERRAEGRHPHVRFAIFLFELVEAFTGRDRAEIKRMSRWGILAAAVLAVLAIVLYGSGAPERELKSLLASGEYARAATAASRSLKRDPDNAELKMLGTEAFLKASLPAWLAMLKARQFDRTDAVLAAMKKLGNDNADTRPLVDELEWIGNLEKFVAARGGAEAPISGSADEERIRRILKQWDDDAQERQRAFVTISSFVPDFKDAYADALSHLRKLALIGGRNGSQRQTP